MKVSVDDLVRCGPDTLAGKFLRRFWQPVYRSEDLAPGSAKPLKILGEEFTIFRGETGKASIVAPRCAHRLTRLHTGRVVGDSIQCLYHGWRYDKTGQCTFQPGENEQFTKGTRISTYPTEEYLGLIWGYFGEGEPPLLERFPDFHRPGLIVPAPVEHWPCNVFNRIDNATDGAHVFYTHAESTTRDGGMGSGAGSEVGEMISTESLYGIQSKMPFGPLDAYFHFIMPNCNMLAATVGRLEGGPSAPQAWRCELHWRVPVDDENFVSFAVWFIDLHGSEAEEYLESVRAARESVGGDPGKLTNLYGDKVLRGEISLNDLSHDIGTRYLFNVEDYVAQVGQGRILDRKQERLGKVDAGTILLRRLWMREMQALEDGKPLKEWVVPEGIVDMTQPQPSWAAEKQSE